LQKTSHRDFFTGFFAADLGAAFQTYYTNTYTSTHDFLGMVVSYETETGYAIVEQRNKFSVGDTVEFIKAKFEQQVTKMYNQKGEAVTAAPHAQELIRIRVDSPVEKFDMLRAVSACQ